MFAHREMLGKKKRRAQIFDLNHDQGSTSEDEHSDRLQSLFRQHFEASFKPLESVSQPATRHEVVESRPTVDEVETDWEGISDEEQVKAQVVVYQSPRNLESSIEKNDFKGFMTSKPPSLSRLPDSTKEHKQSQEITSEEAVTDAANLKKDLALQRLLKESHLLDPQSSLNPSGHNRHKAMDLRLLEMGSKSSLYHQQNMPMAQRRGIAMKIADKEASRRHEAKENGIILEKAINKKKGSGAKRQRGIGAPSVGKFKGGMLKLSKKDVLEIQGPRKISKTRR
ncbi:hypothetical protein MMC07_009100 [Pseudocyphellaria aurata]|nr:hypothetical protein [Pseudocyphellaria aurata]